MSVIKLDAAGAARVRPVAFARGPVAVPDEAQEGLRRHIAKLEGELRQRDDAILHLKTEVGRAFREGTENGRRAGLSEAARLEAERLSLLEAAMRGGQAALESGLAGLEGLAATLAKECLDKMFGACPDIAGLVEKCLAARMDEIGRTMVVAIQVSSRDFTDTAVAAMRDRMGLSSVAVSVSGSLPSGGCRVKSRLGDMDIGLDQQWGVLGDVLADMARPRERE